MKIGAFLSEIMFVDSFALQLIRTPCNYYPEPLMRQQYYSYQRTQCNRIMLNDMDYFLIFYKRLVLSVNTMFSAWGTVISPVPLAIYFFVYVTLVRSVSTHHPDQSLEVSQAARSKPTNKRVV